MIRATRTATLAILGAILLSACSARNEARAAREAALAATTFQAGALGPARRHILTALALRDDVSDFWVLRAQIAAAQGRGQEAYDAYRTVMALDRANVAALRALCQLGAQYGQPAELERFADQLSVLAPGDNLVVTARGNAALRRGNVTAAERFADQALAANATDPLALILKSQILRRARKFDEAADLIRKTSGTLGTSPNMLAALVDIYRQARDRAGYATAIRDLAAAAPTNSDAAVRHADLQYQDGDRAGARATVADLVRRRPDEIEVATRLLDLWLREGAGALTPAELAEDAAGASVEMRAAYAQYANELRRPDLALDIVGAVRSAGFAAPTLNAQAALAEALALRGDRGGARRIVDAILAADPSHPRGLIARSRLAWARGERNPAIADVRQVVADDPTNATVRLLLANYLAGAGEGTLSMSALREGMLADPGSTRVAEALVRRLVAAKRGAAAADVLNDLAASAPLDLRAERLRARLCPATGVATCQGAVRYPTL